MRKYKCLSINFINEGEYSLVPIRDRDKFKIRQWRNDQMHILRQKNQLSAEDQSAYFRNVIDPLFDEEKPAQILFSFLHIGELAGYGGLVHIDWEDMNAEISFLLETERSTNEYTFVDEWGKYLNMIRQIAFNELKLRKIYTYAYDLRPKLYDALNNAGFIQEACLRDHVKIDGIYHSVKIHSLFND